MRADGSSPAQRLTESKNLQVPYSFSPDSKRLSFVEVPPGSGADIWTLPIDWSDPENPKPGKPEQFLVTKANESRPMFSPDGRWLAYFSGESLGTGEIFVRPFPGPGGVWQISNGGGDWPVWSRDGKQLFWQAPNGALMVAGYTVAGNTFIAEKQRVWSVKTRYVGTNREWDLAPDGKRILVMDPQRAETAAPPTHVTLLLNYFDEVRRRTAQ
jgi:serine/threonine-protein kinase